MDIKSNDDDKITHSTKGCLISFITIAVVIVFGILMIYFFGRKDASLEDITINEKNSGLTNYSITFIPKTDIEDLIINFDIYDKNKKFLKTINKNIGTVKKGNQYTSEIHIYDLSIQQIWNSNYISISISGKAHIISF